MGRLLSLSIASALVALVTAGCIVSAPAADPPPPVPVGEVVTVEPAPVERVYVYEPGYPPGTYFYNDYYYYRGYRYERTIFRERIVNVNIERRRYVDVTENRRVGAQIEEQHRVVYKRTGGVRPANPPQGHPAQKPAPRKRDKENK